MFVGGWLLGAQEEAAVGTAAGVFIVGVFLMFCSSMGLLGLLRKSWQLLAVVVVVLTALLIALFGIMTVAFVLGYQMPSLRDIVAESWTKGCADPAHDDEGCLQAETVANNWCFDHGGLAVPPPGGVGDNMFEEGEKDHLCAADPVLNAGTTEEAQKTHLCSVSCQAAMVATLENTMSWVSLGCYIAFATLLLVVLWNSQTHHGLWCFKPSENEDDDENTVMSISPGMAYIAYFLNGTLSLVGLIVAGTAAGLLDSPTSMSALFAILLGTFYFVCGGVSCFAVAKDMHWLLRICSICYIASSIPLLILSLVAAVYSGRIENVYDFYDKNWCRVRGELDIVNADYCRGLSDGVCKTKIVNETADNLAIVAWVILLTLGAIACLIWFSTRLARKFRFDGRDFDEGGVSYADEDDDKGGEDEDDGRMTPLHIGLLAAPWVVALIATIVIYVMLDTEDVESKECILSSARVDFNGTGLYGSVEFTQNETTSEDFDGSLTGTALDVEYQYDTELYPEGVGSPVTRYEIHEFPVPESGDCSAVGDIYPSPAAGTYIPRTTAAGAADPFSSGALQKYADGHGWESLFYNGEVPAPPLIASGSAPAVQLMGTTAIYGRSFVLKATPVCRPNVAADAAACNTAADEDACNAVADNKCTWVSATPACGTISYSGSEWETIANFTAAKGAFMDKIRGAVVFSQVTTRSSESDATIYIELEATDDWDEAAMGSPQDNGCDPTQANDFVSCGHKMHIHETRIDQSTNSAEACNPQSTGGHFNIKDGRAQPGGDATLPCNAGEAGSVERANSCETGDITGKFFPAGLNIGKKGSPAKYFFVDTYDKMHSIMLKGSGTDIGDKSVVMHAHSLGGDRKACADIPIAYPWESLSALGR